MANGSAAAAIAGLAVGIGFMVLLSLASFDAMMTRYTLGLIRDDTYPPLGVDGRSRTEFHATDYGLVLPYTGRIEQHNEYYDYIRNVIEIMLKNATVVELLKGENVMVIGIGQGNCSFGLCAVARLSDIQERSKDIQLIMDYDDQKVLSIRTQNW